MAQATAEKPLALAQARIVGRVTNVRSRVSGANKVFYTLMKLPAPDSYSSPSTVEVRSTERIGSVDADLSIIVNIGGYPRSWEQKDERGMPTGDRVPTAEIALSFVAFA